MIQVIAEALGDKDVLLLANHGCIVVGRSISQAMEDVYLSRSMIMSYKSFASSLFSDAFMTDSLSGVGTTWSARQPGSSGP